MFYGTVLSKTVKQLKSENVFLIELYWSNHNCVFYQTDLAWRSISSIKTDVWFAQAILKAVNIIKSRCWAGLPGFLEKHGLLSRLRHSMFFPFPEPEAFLWGFRLFYFHGVDLIEKCPFLLERKRINILRTKQSTDLLQTWDLLSLLNRFPARKSMDYSPFPSLKHPLAIHLNSKVLVVVWFLHCPCPIQYLLV